ncbi:MAG TPA: nickel-dependent hydrogenase large subunit, partial [Blastocatellia bacterium]|nr:nickel-dependent hydrogenase large subunit [Blastocatellia bacterium]
DDPEGYDGSYENCNEWGERRLATPGAMINGELRTTRLSDLNIGFEEFVEHSYYENWTQAPFESDQLGSPLSPLHPWNKETLARPAGRNWEEKYSWSTAPRWDREPMETGALARLWINAVSGNRNCEFISTARRHLEIALPKGHLPAMNVRWLIPERPNTLERNRARAYQLAYAGIIAYASLLQAFDYVRRGEINMSRRFRVPEKMTIGAGFWEAANGTVTHHLTIQQQRISNYQIITPAEWMGSPRDAVGTPGIYEAAVMNTPLLEECTRPEDMTGIDILRTLRSFDP